MKTIEEIAKQFTDELFAQDDLTDIDTQTEKNDAYVMCMAFGNHLMEQPLADRLTAEEKGAIKGSYIKAKAFYSSERKLLEEDPKHEYQGAVWRCQMELLESIFGKEMFTEKEDPR